MPYDERGNYLYPLPKTKKKRRKNWTCPNCGGNQVKCEFEGVWCANCGLPAPLAASRQPKGADANG